MAAQGGSELWRLAGIPVDLYRATQPGGWGASHCWPESRPRRARAATGGKIRCENGKSGGKGILGENSPASVGDRGCRPARCGDGLHPRASLPALNVPRAVRLSPTRSRRSRSAGGRNCLARPLWKRPPGGFCVAIPQARTIPAFSCRYRS